jgi:hypothetical protein
VNPGDVKSESENPKVIRIQFRTRGCWLFEFNYHPIGW